MMLPSMKIEKNLTYEEIHEYVSKGWLYKVPDKYLTYELCLLAAKSSYRNSIPNFPKEFISEELCLEIFKKIYLFDEGSFNYENIPIHCRTYNVFFLLTKQGYYHKMMNKLMDANMAYVLVKANPRKYYKINKKFRTPEITLFYIEYCDKWCKKITFNNIPKHGYSFAVFIKILETDLRYYPIIPTEYKTNELFDYITKLLEKRYVDTKLLERIENDKKRCIRKGILKYL